MRKIHYSIAINDPLSNDKYLVVINGWHFDEEGNKIHLPIKSEKDCTYDEIPNIIKELPKTI